MKGFFGKSSVAIGFAVVGVGVLESIPAHAACLGFSGSGFSCFTDRTAWEREVRSRGNLGLSSIENFLLPPRLIPNGISFRTIGIESTKQGLNVSRNAVANGSYLGSLNSNSSGSSIKWRFPTTASAFGGFFRGVNVNNNTSPALINLVIEVLQPRQVNEQVNEQEIAEIPLRPSLPGLTPNFRFFGFVAEQGNDFTSINFRADNLAMASSFRIDNVQFAAIPEPTTMVGVALGGGGLALLRRKQKQASR
jgi:hypothetical protein